MAREEHPIAAAQTPEPNLFPAFLDLKGRAVLVVGGGKVAARKIASLIESGARVTVVAPEIAPEIVAVPAVSCELRAWRPADVDGKWLVVAATDDVKLNRAVFDAAAQARVFCNVADDPTLCSFQVPAVVRQGSLQVAISTGGASPGLARRLRERLEEEFGPVYQPLLAALGDLRRHLRAKYPDDGERRRQLMNAFLDSGAPDLLLKQNDAAAFQQEVERWKSR